ncbi:MAG: glycosyltransferase family 39 protein [Chloroflexi bacterium]|nr:glycosyltransferase family 39 protein [Chloroflexota bacterium]
MSSPLQNANLIRRIRRRLPSGASLFLPGILLLAVALRCYGLARESLWLDEATSLMLARMDVPTLIRWTSLDIHPPLYYTLLHFWIRLGESEAIVRGLSVMAGVFAVGVIYALGEALFDKRTGLLAALLLAVAPMHVWYSQEARMYAWVALLMAASLLMALRAWQTGRWPWWVGYVLITSAALYTHYYAVFVVGVENLLVLYGLFRGWARGRLLRVWALAQLGVFLLFLPWFPIFLLPITIGGGGWITMGVGRPSLSALAQTAVLYMVGFGRELYPTWLRRLGYLLFGGLLVMGAWPQREPKPIAGRDGVTLRPVEALGMTLGYLALPLGLAWGVSQVFKPMYSARYMLPFLLPFLLLVARGVARLPRALGQVAMAALVVLGLVGVQAQVTALEKPDWRGLAQRLIERSEPGDVVLFMPGWHAKPFDYYAQGALDLYSDVPIPVPRYGEKALAAVDEALVGHRRVWFVWENEHYTDPDGEVFKYLFQHCRLVENAPLERVGQVMLFAYCAPDEAGR